MNTTILKPSKLTLQIIVGLLFFGLFYLATRAGLSHANKLARTPKPQAQIVLLKTYVSTNQIPGYISGPSTTVGPDGFLLGVTTANAIVHPPRTEVVTNYVLGYWDGTNSVELLTAQKL